MSVNDAPRLAVVHTPHLSPCAPLHCAPPPPTPSMSQTNDCDAKPIHTQLTPLLPATPPPQHTEPCATSELTSTTTLILTEPCCFLTRATLAALPFPNSLWSCGTFYRATHRLWPVGVFESFLVVQSAQRMRQHHKIKSFT